MTKTMVVLSMALLQGCAGVSAVGIWVQNDDTRRSFAYSWHRDRDPNWQEPDRTKPQTGVRP